MVNLQCSEASPSPTMSSIPVWFGHTHPTLHIPHVNHRVQQLHRNSRVCALFPSTFQESDQKTVRQPHTSWLIIFSQRTHITVRVCFTQLWIITAHVHDRRLCFHRCASPSPVTGQVQSPVPTSCRGGGGEGFTQSGQEDFVVFFCNYSKWSFKFVFR